MNGGGISALIDIISIKLLRYTKGNIGMASLWQILKTDELSGESGVGECIKRKVNAFLNSLYVK
jgi:hypothetical protein